MEENKTTECSFCGATHGHHSAECVDTKGKGYEAPAHPQGSPSKSSELLSCPFCGSTPGIRYWNGNIADSVRYECQGCGCSLLWEETQSDALEAWNKRAV